MGVQWSEESLSAQIREGEGKCDKNWVLKKTGTKIHEGLAGDERKIN